jgi:transcriptional regulator with XRE-family HTH domain
MKNEHMTPSLARAARAILNWSMKDSARITGIAETTVRDYENGSRQPHHLTWRALAEAYYSQGIEFVGGPDQVPGLLVHRAELLDNPPPPRQRRKTKK